MSPWTKEVLPEGPEEVHFLRWGRGLLLAGNAQWDLEDSSKPT